MKTKILLSAILGCGLVAFSFNTAAQGTNNPGPSLNEKFVANITLTATPDAPEGAKGKAQVRSETDDSGQTGTLKLQTTGLEPGDYVVSFVRASDAGTVDIGQFTIEDPDGNTNNNRRLKSISEIDLPSDLDASDLGQLIVSSGGTQLLIGDLFEPATKSKANFSGIVPITPGLAAPDATGFARLKTIIKKGVEKNKFSLKASGVPADTTFAIDVDGADGGTVTSDRRGRVSIKSLPDGLTGITTVRLLDDTTTEVLRAEF